MKEKSSKKTDKFQLVVRWIIRAQIAIAIIGCLACWIINLTRVKPTIHEDFIYAGRSDIKSASLGLYGEVFTDYYQFYDTFIFETPPLTEYDFENNNYLAFSMSDEGNCPGIIPIDYTIADNNYDIYINMYTDVSYERLNHCGKLYYFYLLKLDKSITDAAAHTMLSYR